MARYGVRGLPAETLEQRDIVVVGGGGHARVVISILRKLPHFTIKGFTDLKRIDNILGVPFLGSDFELAKLVEESGSVDAVLAVGQMGLGRARQAIWQKLASSGSAFPAIVSPDAIVNEAVGIEGAVVVMDGAIISTGARLGVGAIANTHSTIEHDVNIGDWVHIAPGATISGGVTVGSFSMIGSGATIIEGRAIASDTIVGAGATVIDNIVQPGVYVGTPARRIK